MERDFKGVWIPKEVWLDERLTALDKIILVEVNSLCFDDKGCFASNEYLANFCQCSVSAISKSISKLVKIGLLYTENFDGRKRELKCVLGRLVNFTRQTSKICQADEQNLPAVLFNNIDNNIINNKLLTSEQVARPTKSKKDEFKKLFDWWSKYSESNPEIEKQELYDIFERSNNSARLSACVILTARANGKLNLGSVLANYDSFIEQAQAKAFGIKSDGKKLKQVLSEMPKKKTPLQIFSNIIIEKFEQLENDDQKKVWFKRQCRVLSDILNFCGKDVLLATKCVEVCAERLEKAGLSGGYEAVLRNITTYYQEAKRRLK